MGNRHVTLPDIGSVEAAPIAGYSLDPNGRTLRLWIDAYADSIGLVRVFTSEADDEVAVLVIPTPPKYRQGYTCGWTDEDIALDVADVVANLEAPLETRRVTDASSERVIEPIAAWIVQRKAQDPAPRLRPIGTQSQNDPLTFRGEL